MDEQVKILFQAEVLAKADLAGVRPGGSPAVWNRVQIGNIIALSRSRLTSDGIILKTSRLREAGTSQSLSERGEYAMLCWYSADQNHFPAMSRRAVTPESRWSLPHVASTAGHHASSISPKLFEHDASLRTEAFWWYQTNEKDHQQRLNASGGSLRRSGQHRRRRWWYSVSNNAAVSSQAIAPTLQLFFWF